MNKITKEILNYIEGINIGALDNWYAGITSNLSQRIEHHEREKNIVCECLKSWTCKTEDEAREIEKELGEKGISIYKNDLKIIANKKSSPKTIVYVFLAVSQYFHFSQK